jgi:aminoglycoside/choline kinase family phosphotransferase
LNTVSETPLPGAIAQYLERHRLTGGDVIALTGDASDRRYYRVRPSGSEPFVLALHTAAFEPGSLPFVNVAELLGRMPLPIPHVRDEAADLGLLALDDLGDVTLQAHIGNEPPEQHLSRYERAVDHLVVLQQRGAELADDRYLPYRLAFDVDKLMWEMDFFLQHFLAGFRGVELAAAERAALRAQLLVMVEELAAEPRVLCHRDYHSRNLMVVGAELFVIDFQDARMGPDTYDLVSLLRDSYVELPDTAADGLIERFRSRAGIGGSAGAFRARFDLMALQRNLKALGTFGYQAVARANPVYAQYVPRTLAYIRRNLASQQRFGELHALLAERVPELAS